MMKLIEWALIVAAMSLVAGCETSGDFCLVASPIRHSVDDSLTAGTGDQILKHNRYGEKACGWKP